LLPESVEITSHCLLRLTTALALEAAGLPHGFPLAAQELNERTSRNFSAREWLEVLEPAYLKRFSPNDPNHHLV
jgi:hypothetical protein